MLNREKASKEFYKKEVGAVGQTCFHLRKLLFTILFLICISFVLVSCKKENNVRKIQETKATEESSSSLSEEEAIAMAKELESLEQKEQESLDKEYASQDSSLVETSSAPDSLKGEKQEESYPYEDYPYDPKEDRGKVNLEKPDIVVGDKLYATQINDWYMNFQDYEGKTVSIDGYYMNFGGYTLVGRMGPSCPYCTGGYVNFEFKTDLDLSKLKSEESWIRVKGILRKGKYSISNDISQLIYYIEALEVEELPEVGVDTVAD